MWLSPRQVIICTGACILYTLYAFERIALHKEDCYPSFFTKNFFKNKIQSFYSSVFSKLFTVSPLPHPRAICHSLILLLSFHAHICMMLFKVFKTLYTALALSLFPLHRVCSLYRACTVRSNAFWIIVTWDPPGNKMMDRHD